MVISYNQNLYFIIHCKQIQKQYSFHHILILQNKFTQQHEHQIHYRSLCFFVLLKT
jgi:hypothetical protein